MSPLMEPEVTDQLAMIPPEPVCLPSPVSDDALSPCAAHFSVKSTVVPFGRVPLRNVLLISTLTGEIAGGPADAGPASTAATATIDAQASARIRLSLSRALRLVTLPPVHRCRGGYSMRRARGLQAGGKRTGRMEGEAGDSPSIAWKRVRVLASPDRTQMGLFDPLRQPSHLGAREVLDLRRKRKPGCGVTFEEAPAG